jgi:hypothetical protein
MRVVGGERRALVKQKDSTEPAPPMTRSAEGRTNKGITVFAVRLSLCPS